MGIYSGDMIIAGEPPQILPKLCIAVWILSEAGSPPKKITIRLLGPPSKTEIFVVENEIDPNMFSDSLKPDSTRVSLYTQIPILNLQISSAGSLEVMVDTEEGEERAGRLDVKFISTNVNLSLSS